MAGKYIMIIEIRGFDNDAEKDFVFNQILYLRDIFLADKIKGIIESNGTDYLIKVLWFGFVQGVV